MVLHRVVLSVKLLRDSRTIDRLSRERDNNCCRDIRHKKRVSVVTETKGNVA